MRKRVLIVEDTPVIREVLLKHLHTLDVNCYAVETGEEAVELAPYFDLILMDVRLPGISGVEATRRIRKHEFDRGLEPVIIVANTNGENRRECLSAGMDDYYSKPITLEAVREMVETWIAASPNKLRALS